MSERRKLVKAALNRQDKYYVLIDGERNGPMFSTANKALKHAIDVEWAADHSIEVVQVVTSFYAE